MLNTLLSVGSSPAVALPVGEMMRKLCLTVLLPIALGKAIAASGKRAKVRLLPERSCPWKAEVAES